MFFPEFYILFGWILTQVESTIQQIAPKMSFFTVRRNKLFQLSLLVHSDVILIINFLSNVKSEHMRPLPYFLAPTPQDWREP